MALITTPGVTTITNAVTTVAVSVLAPYKTFNKPSIALPSLSAYANTFPTTITFNMGYTETIQSVLPAYSILGPIKYIVQARVIKPSDSFASANSLPQLTFLNIQRTTSKNGSTALSSTINITSDSTNNQKSVSTRNFDSQEGGIIGSRVSTQTTYTGGTMNTYIILPGGPKIAREYWF